MKKSKKQQPIMTRFPEAYRFLQDAVAAFFREDVHIKADRFLALSLEKQQYYQAVEAKREAQPVEQMLLLSQFYKRFPAKKYAETQQIQYFLTRMSGWRNTAVLDQLPPHLHNLIHPIRNAAIWSDSDIEDFVYRDATSDDWADMAEVRHLMKQPENQRDVDAFLDRYPQNFFHESRNLVMYFVVMEHFY